MGIRNYLLKLALLSSDFFIVNLSFVLAQLIALRFDAKNLEPTLYTCLAYNIIWLLFGSINGLYSRNTMADLEEIFRKTFRTTILQIAVFAVFMKLYAHRISWDFLAIGYSSLILMLFLSRFYLTYVIEFIIKKVRLHKKIAIVGFNETSIKLAEYFKGIKEYQFEGFFDSSIKQSALSEIYVNGAGKIIGDVADCIDFAVENDIREIYSTILPSQDTIMINDLLDVADKNCIRIKFVPDFMGSFSNSYQVESVGTFPVISLRSEPLQDYNKRVKKRIADIVISACVTVFVLSWLVPIIAILIKLESKGPVFFKQQRSGRDNQPFWCYKFRSMTVNNDSDKQQASRGDTRITKIGAILRKTSLDEFPQFFNVLRGDMSIVGPRPHMLRHTEEYSSIISKYMVRQFLKPGITGWAQVNGYRGETKDPILMERRVEHDIWYMENWSLMLDVKIMFMTAINIFKGEENAF